MYRYKNKSDQELTVIGLGVLAPGEEFEATKPVENPNLELISDPTDEATEPQDGGAPASDENTTKEITE